MDENQPAVLNFGKQTAGFSRIDPEGFTYKALETKYFIKDLQQVKVSNGNLTKKSIHQLWSGKIWIWNWRNARLNFRENLPSFNLISFGPSIFQRKEPVPSRFLKNSRRVYCGRSELDRMNPANSSKEKLEI